MYITQSLFCHIKSNKLPLRLLKKVIKKDKFCFLAGVVELVDAPDSKSGMGDTMCGFESHLRHTLSNDFTQSLLFF